MVIFILLKSKKILVKTFTNTIENFLIKFKISTLPFEFKSIKVIKKKKNKNNYFFRFLDFPYIFTIQTFYNEKEGNNFFH